MKGNRSVFRLSLEFIKDILHYGIEILRIKLFVAKRDYIVKRKPQLKKQWAVSITLVVFIVLSFLYFINPFDIVNQFFRADKAPSEVFTYIGVICGAIILIGNLYSNTKRNLLTERGQLDIRFKDAALLLSSDNNTAILSGIYALHKIAEEDYKDNSSRGYVMIVCQIFCAFLKEKFSQKTKLENYNHILIQTILDLLLKNDRQIYTECKFDFTSILFYNINFRECYLEKVSFYDNEFIQCVFSGSYLINSKFHNCSIKSVKYDGTELNSVLFNNSNLEETTFHGASLSKTVFKDGELSKCRMNRAHFKNVKIINMMVDDSKIENAKIIDSVLVRSNISFSSFDKSCMINIHFSNSFIQDSSFDNMKRLGNIGFNNAKLNNVTFLNSKLAKFTYDEIVTQSLEITKYDYDPEKELLRDLVKISPRNS